METAVPTMAQMIEQGIQFLTEKGVYASFPEMQQLQFALIRNPASAATDETKKKYEQMQQWVIILVTINAEVHSDTLQGLDIHQFSEEEFPGYQRDNIFFLKHPAVKCQRYQKSGLCYMHGPAIIQHYKLAKNNHSVPMIDLLQFVKQQFSTKQLTAHIFADEGGDSHTFLRSILEPHSAIFSVFVNDDDATTSDNIEALFEQYGPCLVSQFHVYDCFYRYACYLVSRSQI